MYKLLIVDDEEEVYLLKLFSNNQCIDVIKKVISDIELERKEYVNIQQLKVNYHITLPIIIHEKYLTSLIARQMSAHEHVN